MDHVSHFWSQALSQWCQAIDKSQPAEADAQVFSPKYEEEV